MRKSKQTRKQDDLYCFLPIHETNSDFWQKKIIYWDKLLLNIFWGQASQAKLIDLLHSLHSSNILYCFEADI